VGDKIIKEGNDDMNQNMKYIRHIMLKSSANILEPKGNTCIIGKVTPQCGKVCFILVPEIDVNLIISREVIQKGEEFMTHTYNDDLVNEWCGVIIFGVGCIEILKINLDVYSPCFLQST